LIDPNELVKSIKDLPIDGIIITEHNYMWNLDEREKLRKYCPDTLILFGMELTCKHSLHYLIYVDQSVKGMNLYEYMDEVEMFKEAQKWGGVVVPAHMFRYAREVDVFDVSLTPVDGLEVKSTNISDDEMRKTVDIAKALNISMIAGSDAHHIRDVGRYYTQFDDKILTEGDIVKAIKSQSCRAVIL
jgi:predicted metal-dependent phosphoesterase TrpH